MCQGINPIVGVYIPIIRIPIKGGMTIPNIGSLDHGTYDIPIYSRNIPFLQNCIVIYALAQYAN